MMALGMRSCMLCRTMEKYEAIKDRIKEVSISSRIVRLEPPSDGICSHNQREH